MFFLYCFLSIVCLFFVGGGGGGGGGRLCVCLYTHVRQCEMIFMHVWGGIRRGELNNGFN